LPKCDAVIFSQRSHNPNQDTQQHQQHVWNKNATRSATNGSPLSSHALQCRKLSELSITKAPQHSPHFKHAQNCWRPNDGFRPRENIKLRSAEERGRKTSSQISASPLKRTGYKQFIKRVLEHYDPSQNQIRSRGISHDLNSKGLVASQ